MDETTSLHSKAADSGVPSPLPVEEHAMEAQPTPATSASTRAAAGRSAGHGPDDLPLCVDLDGTLIRTDLLVESFFRLLKIRFLYVFLALWWLLHGKARLKDEIARRVELDVKRLPYNVAFLEYLRQERARGRSLCLATSSHERYARAIAAHLGIFAQVYATNAALNLSGPRKHALLCQTFGERAFDYAGNSRADLAVFSGARTAILVNGTSAVRRAAPRRTVVARTFDGPPIRLRTWVKTLRLHQWLKNLLVFVPLVADHKIGNITALAQASVAFIAFGLCASSVYVLNDLLDLDADRQHPRKRQRPFAAGVFPIMAGALLTPVLLAASFAIALWRLPLAFDGALALYFIVTLTYSFWLKGKLMIDVLVLAALYTLRIIAGAAAIEILPSFWLLALSMFLFLSLAMVKRYSELLAVAKSGDGRMPGRNYQANDYQMLSSLGAASGYAAVMVLALYINSPDVLLNYRYPMAIWLLCPLLLYWISRVWALTGRGEMHDDPVVFALRDRNSRWLVVVGGIILLLAT